MYMFNKHVHAMKMLIHRRLNAKNTTMYMFVQNSEKKVTLVILALQNCIFSLTPLHLRYDFAFTPLKSLFIEWEENGTCTDFGTEVERS